MLASLTLAGTPGEYIHSEDRFVSADYLDQRFPGAELFSEVAATPGFCLCQSDDRQGDSGIVVEGRRSEWTSDAAPQKQLDHDGGDPSNLIREQEGLRRFFLFSALEVDRGKRRLIAFPWIQPDDTPRCSGTVMRYPASNTLAVIHRNHREPGGAHRQLGGKFIVNAFLEYGTRYR